MRLGVTLLLLLFLVCPPYLLANPSGQEVVAGQASFATNGSTLTITNSDRAIIQWQDFSIQSGEITHFIQPNSLSSVLNRVVGGNLSAIYGTLSSNGQVMLINPNGILIGAGGIVDTAGFTASTLDVSNSQFLNAGGMKFVGASEQSVVNLGKIGASVGDVVLIARHVDNQGEIHAASGNAGLYAGQEVYLADGSASMGIVQVASSVGSGVNNDGLIDAAKAELKATGNLYSLAIKNTGVIRATGTQTINGLVHFQAKGGAIQIANNSLIQASNPLAKSGGEIRVEADQIAMTDQVTLDASGQVNGGTILIGGDTHGANSAVYNAQKVFIDSGVRLLADGGQDLNRIGEGGKIVVWSDDSTQFYGFGSARAGDNGGNGGFAEVSGHNFLDYQGLVDLRAPQGQNGSLLLDPTNITISPSVNSNITTGSNGTFSANPSTNSNSTLNYSTLQTQLGVGNVIVSTASAGTALGDIVITGSALSWGSTSSLSLLANGNITIQTGINASSGTLVLQSPGFVSQMPSTPITVASLLLLGSGNFVLSDANNNIANFGANLTGSGNLYVFSKSALNAMGVSTSGTNATISSGGNLQVGAINVGALSLQSTGTLTQTQGITASSLLIYSGGGVNLNHPANQVANVNLINANGPIAFVDSTPLNVTGIVTTNTSGGNVILQALNGDLTLAPGSQVTTSGPGNISLVTSNKFINNAGGGVLSVSGGRWLVYSADTTKDNTGGLTGTTLTSGSAFPTVPSFSGNGFIGQGNVVNVNMTPPPPPGSANGSSGTSNTTIAQIRPVNINPPPIIVSLAPQLPPQNGNPPGQNTGAGPNQGPGNNREPGPNPNQGPGGNQGPRPDQGPGGNQGPGPANEHSAPPVPGGANPTTTSGPTATIAPGLGQTLNPNSIPAVMGGDGKSNNLPPNSPPALALKDSIETKSEKALSDLLALDSSERGNRQASAPVPENTAPPVPTTATPFTTSGPVALIPAGQSQTLIAQSIPVIMGGMGVPPPLPPNSIPAISLGAAIDNSTEGDLNGIILADHR